LTDTKRRYPIAPDALELVAMRDDRHMPWKQIAKYFGIRVDSASSKYARTKKRMKENNHLKYDKPDTVIPRVVSNDELIPHIDTTLLRLLEEFRTRNLQEMTPRDLTTAVNMFLEKHKLYAGEPTDIIERRSATEILPKLLDEFKRRGMDIEAIKTTYEEEK